ncbi:RUN domain-containing protein 1-like [Watersipora subatra]|uniref:RUN domain-containing protein 1-like n=1 Tax=Watersipora subatra TaxID=2589382 RepID=UPI00355C72EB
MATVASIQSISDDSEWPDSDTPAERWAPLGAVAESPPTSTDKQGTYLGQKEHDVHSLLTENDKMANSLLSLTSHFAQVQFRLKQIIEGPEESKSERLKELEEFAERGIPDIRSCVVPTTQASSDEKREEEYKKRLSDKQREMIGELKSSLADLESYAYENGLAQELPTSKKLEKQDIIIEEIRRKLEISHLDNLASLSAAELRECVDEAISQIVNPAKVREKQVEQLQTQVVDLERFVDFLQAEVTQAQKEAQSRAPTKVKSPKNSPLLRPHMHADAVRTQGTGSSVKSEESEAEDLVSKVKRIAKVLHIYIISELSCGRRQRDVQRNDMKHKPQPHYGDLLAEVQMAVDALVDTAEQVKHEKQNSILTDCDYLSEEETYISESKELTKCVRKRFASCLKSIIEHGAAERHYSRALIPFASCGTRASVKVHTKHAHAWEIILKYYELKDGKVYNQSPSQKLANAFAMDEMKNKTLTVKQTLLSAICTIVETHEPYQRGHDSQFKAFVSLALNEKKLVPWLRQIFRTPAIIDLYYEPWSYLVKTGFEDVFCSMNKLRLYEFNLPVNLAVKQFHEIKDAF